MERANSLYVANGDIHDEQMAGIGELLSELNSSISEIAESLSRRKG